MRPVTDRAEIAIDFPEKTYMGSFGHTATFAAIAAAEGIEFKLVHAGHPKRAVDLHLHWYLFADMLDEIAASLEGRTHLVGAAHRAALAEVVARLAASLGAAPADVSHPAARAESHG